jgi:hypothetical protein
MDAIIEAAFIVKAKSKILDKTAKLPQMIAADIVEWAMPLRRK